MSEINVVPYIDVMLVLLVIFMVTAPLMTQGIKVDLPEAASGPPGAQDAQDEEAEEQDAQAAVALRPVLLAGARRRSCCEFLQLFPI